MSKPGENTGATDTLNIDNIDDFLPMPGADSIVTPTDDDEPKPTVFTKNVKPADLSFLDDDSSSGSDDDADDDKKDKKPTAAEVQQTLAALDEELEGADDDDAKKPGRKKIDKSGLVETFSKLTEE